MPRKFLYILTILLAALSLTITACETDDDEDATDGGGSTGATTTGGSPATGGTPAAGGSAATGGTGGTPEYRFVRVIDNSTDGDSEDPGADIDAIGVRSAATGMTQWATSMEGTSGDNSSGDPQSVLGEPTAFPDWASGDTSTCNANATAGGFWSAGANGGGISVGFANTFTTGDTVVVYEVGNCTIDGGGTARTEAISIDVATTGDIAGGDWVTVISATEGSPLIEATIP